MRSEMVCEKRGGLLLRPGVVQIFGREAWLPYFSASVPFAKLTCYRASITISVSPLLMTTSIPLGEVDRVEFRTVSLLTLPLGDTLRIYHRTDAANPVIFSSYGGLGPVLDALEGWVYQYVAALNDGAAPC